AALDDDAVPEHAADDEAAPNDGAVGDEGIECLARASRRVGTDLRRTEAARDREQGPRAVVEVERRPRRAEVHLRVVVVLERRGIVPEGAGPVGRAREAVLEDVVDGDARLRG